MIARVDQVRRRRRSERLTNPDRIGERYESSILRYVAPLRRLTVAFILRDLPKIVAAVPSEMKRADDDRPFSEILAEATLELGVKFAEASPDEMAEEAAETAAEDVSEHNRKELARAISVDPFRSEPWLADYLTDSVRDNVALIKSIPMRYFSELEKIVGDGARQGLRHEEIAKVILSRYADKTRPDLWAKAKSRAKLIARDQVAKFNGEINRVRQTNLGLTRYVWSTSQDERVRPEHARREGKIFEWSKPPRDGHPGIPVQCRCVALPIVEDILES